MKEIRTRYAPSPTGYMHIGNLRTALYEYLIARRGGGSFILRIEDTDQERLVEDSLEVIFNTLKLVGMHYDEGPYYQSQRLDLYAPYGEELVEKGQAYYCFCTKERLDALKASQEAAGEFPHYDGCCRELPLSEAKARVQAGEAYVIRQKMPREGITLFDDVVYGQISVENRELEDQILLKSDGFPTYNFANVVDDHLMGITHVVRGSEYLASTPKYNLLYQAFGWEIPVYVHLPLILNENGQKLSKRLGDQSFEDLLQEGYLVDAVINYIALLGWSPGSDREFFTLKELEEAFDIAGISKSPAIFDKKKLRWMNGEYIRKMSSEDFHEAAAPYIRQALGDAFDTRKIADLLQKRVEVLTEIPPQLDFLIADLPYDTQLFVHKKMKTDKALAASSLALALAQLDEGKEGFPEDLQGFLESLAAAHGLKNGQLLWPLRVALSGKEQSPGGAAEIMRILGLEESLRRIRRGLDKLKEELEA